MVKKYTRRGLWKNPRKTLITLSVIFVLIILSASSILNRPLIGIDETATKYINKTMLKAGVTYAAARGLNATISLIQESRIGFDFFVSGEVALFEILDPINDLVEKFSTVMLISTVSLGIQKVALEIGKLIGISVLLTSSLILLFIALVLPDRLRRTKEIVKNVGLKILIVSIVIRIAIPVIALVSSGVNNLFLESKYNEAQKELEDAHEKGKEANIFLDNYVMEGEGHRLFKMKSRKETGQDVTVQDKEGNREEKFSVNIKKSFTRVVNAIKNITTYIIDLIIIFIVQTIIIPLLTLWGLLRIAKLILGRQVVPSSRKITRKVF